MRGLFRRYVALALVAVLVLTGHSMAVARGMPGVAGYAELCLSEAAVMVPVDADGKPTGPPHICPDFAASVFSWVESAGVAVGPVTGAARSLRILRGRYVEAIRSVAVNARAPPVVVFL